MSKSPRINVSLDPIELEIIQLLSKKKKLSMSSLIKKMVEDWLEDYEDMLLSKKADRLHEEWEKNGKKTISHEEFWKDLI